MLMIPITYVRSPQRSSVMPLLLAGAAWHAPRRPGRASRPPRAAGPASGAARPPAPAPARDRRRRGRDCRQLRARHRAAPVASARLDRPPRVKIGIGSSAARERSMAGTRLPRMAPKTSGKRRMPSSSRACARARAPAGLWAPSSRTSPKGVPRSSSSRPGQRTSRSPARMRGLRDPIERRVPARGVRPQRIEQRRARRPRCRPGGCPAGRRARRAARHRASAGRSASRPSRPRAAVARYGRRGPASAERHTQLPAALERWAAGHDRWRRSRPGCRA